MKKVVFFLATAMMCIAASAQTFSEDFEGVTLSGNPSIGQLPSGWSTYEDDLTNAYGSNADYRPYGSGWSVVSIGGTKMAFSITYTVQGTACDRWLITPAISVPNDGTDYALYFDAIASQYSEHLQVLISTTDAEKASFTTTAINEHPVPEGFNNRMVNLSNYAGQDVYVAFVAKTADGLYLGIDNVEFRAAEHNAISLSTVQAPQMAEIGEEFGIAVTVRNEGIDPLTSFDLTYTAGSTTETVNVTGINVAPFESYTHTILLTFNDPQLVDITITVSNPNGEEDSNPDDNYAEGSVSIYDPSLCTTRTTLLEHFTTARCPNCPAGHTRIEDAIANYTDRVIWVAHHCGYYTDDFTLPESEALQVLFNANYTYAPAAMLDRSHDLALLAPATDDVPAGPVFFPNTASSLINQFNAALAIPSMVSCEITGLNYNSSSRELNFNVEGHLYNALSGDPRMTVYVVEDSIVGAQSGASNRYVHSHVIRACLTDAWGDDDAITDRNAGADFSKSFSYTLPATSRANKCYVVAFINNFNQSNVNDRLVLNSTKSDLLTTVGIDDVQPTVSLTTYPNPATEIAYIQAESTIRSVEVVNTLGQRVFAQAGVDCDVYELSVSTLPSGVYFVNVATDKGSSTARLTVVK